MIAHEKAADFEVIAVPADNISYHKTDKGHADITITVQDNRDGQDEQYYVLKRPASMNERVFKIALEAAFRTATELSEPVASADKGAACANMRLKGGKTRTRTTNTERLEQLKKTILDDSEWLPAQEVSRRVNAGGTVKNPSGLPNRWKQSGKIFAITAGGKDLYPGYALDIGGQPLPLIKKIIALFGETKTPWSLAVWFGSPNSWLGNKKPKDLLVSAPGKVLEAAVQAKEGPVHG